MTTLEDASQLDGGEIAVVGMALRVPGANNLEEFWTNLRDGVESVQTLTDQELRAAGVTDAALADVGLRVEPHGSAFPQS